MPKALLERLKARHYRRSLQRFDERDEPDMQIVRVLVLPAATVVDVGANVGIYTKLLSELVGPSGRVMSIEPVPETFSILSANVRHLRLGNVTLLNAAASNAEGSATMRIPRVYTSGGQNFYEAAIVAPNVDRARTAANASPPVRSVVVPMTTLDVALRGQGPIAFIKCDVEGHEAACVAGAARTLSEDRPAWLVEISGNPDANGSATAKLFDTFRAAGCTPWLLDGGLLRRRREGDHSTNYFFLTDAHVDRVRERAPAVLGGV